MPDPGTLRLPGFARLTEYCCLWLLEPQAAARIWEYARQFDLFGHVAARQMTPQAVAPPLEMVPGRGKKSIAMIRGMGTLMKQQPSLGGTSTIAMRRAVRQAAHDPEVGGILLALDSPGGTVAGTADLGNEVRAARRKKPTWAHIDDLGASAAYWIASQADQVWANAPTALVGSVGTVLTVEDTTARNERLGVKELAFTSGPLKTMGAGLGVTEEQAVYLQSIVNSIQHEFAEAVRRGRGLSPERLATVQSGAIYPAAEAQKLRLIDGVRPLEQTLDALARAQ
jgi:signal peptide peptidase SppA